MTKQNPTIPSDWPAHPDKTMHRRMFTLTDMNGERLYLELTANDNGVNAVWDVDIELYVDMVSQPFIRRPYPKELSLLSIRGLGDEDAVQCANEIAEFLNENVYQEVVDFEY